MCERRFLGENRSVSRTRDRKRAPDLAEMREVGRDGRYHWRNLVKTITEPMIADLIAGGMLEDARMLQPQLQGIQGSALRRALRRPANRIIAAGRPAAAHAERGRFQRQLSGTWRT